MSARSSSNVKERRQLKPAHVKAPVSKTDPERIKLTLRVYWTCVDFAGAAVTMRRAGKRAE